MFLRLQNECFAGFSLEIVIREKFQRDDEFVYIHIRNHFWKLSKWVHLRFECWLGQNVVFSPFPNAVDNYGSESFNRRHDRSLFKSKKNPFITFSFLFSVRRWSKNSIQSRKSTTHWRTGRFKSTWLLCERASAIHSFPCHREKTKVRSFQFIQRILYT